nr:Fic family protein [uncultured Treponema sp.]
METLNTLLQQATKLQALINKKRPFEGNQLIQLQKYYKCESTWSSNALEGNTISLHETQMILEQGLTIHGHTLNEIYECTGHDKAYDCMFNQIHKKEIDEKYIKELHYLFAKDIKNIPYPGEYRDVSKTFVTVTGSEYSCPDYDEVPAKMTELVDWTNTMRDVLHPIELASQMHRRFVYIHPFPDGNGRVARLLMNTVLLQEHYMPVLIEPKQRAEYIRTLENGRIYPTGFDIFIAQRELEQQRRFMKLLNIEISQNISEEKKEIKKNQRKTNGEYDMGY